MNIAKMQVLCNKATVENLQNVIYAKKSGEILRITSTLTSAFIGLQLGKLLEDNLVLPVESLYLKTGDAQSSLAQCVIKSSATTA